MRQFCKMKVMGGLLLLFLAASSLGNAMAATMTDSWAVQLQSGGKQAAATLASKYGFANMGKIGNLENVYHFLKNTNSSKEWKMGASGFSEANFVTKQLRAEQNVVYAKQQVRRKLYKKGYTVPNDPYWSYQWSLLNTGQLNATDVGNDINVERAWLQGVTGCDTVVAIVDDGVEYTHSDLSKHYVRSIQHDFLDHDSDPFPETRKGVRENHGTHSAGVVAMEKGNSKCGVGVAYNSFITGLRLISAPGATDLDEAEALSWQNNQIDIYSNGWGPLDDGQVVSGPGELLQMAMERSILKGRGGKGSIYTFAAGNGGSQDTCAADGYTNSIYTISVGSAASNGRQSAFDESCSGKMVVTFDSDPYKDKQHVVTSGTKNSCYGKFRATSASTSLVSGVLALLLEANPSLTWRDVQYLIAYTANRNNLVDGQWVTNGGGLRVSHKFGFGAIDAEAIVSRGRHWISVPSQMSQNIVPSVAGSCTTHIYTMFNHYESSCYNSTLINHGENTSISFSVNSKLAFLEHVVVLFDMQFVSLKMPDYFSKSSWSGRGSVRVQLTSPSGTTSTLLPLRPGDSSPGSYDSWPLMSVHFWGERPGGTWTLAMAYTGHMGTIRVAFPHVTLYGTSKVPTAVSRALSTCSARCDSTRGCAASGAGFCDACAKLRLASNLACVSTCTSGLTRRNGYCYDTTKQESSCNPPMPTKVAPSASHTHTPISPTHSAAVPTTTTVPIETGTAEPTAAPKSSSAPPMAEKAKALLFISTSAVILGIWY